MMPEILFNVRVYGLWVQNNRILVTDEIREGRKMTKFPGGGLQFGEGLRETLEREWKEETGQTIEVGDHFYTTDFFQPSAFNKDQQVINIYYWVRPATSFEKPVKEQSFDFPEEREGVQVFRWVPLSENLQEEVTLPIEQEVARRLTDHR